MPRICQFIYFSEIILKLYLIFWEAQISKNPGLNKMWKELLEEKNRKNEARGVTFFFFVY